MGLPVRRRGANRFPMRLAVRSLGRSGTASACSALARFPASCREPRGAAASPPRLRWEVQSGRPRPGPATGHALCIAAGQVADPCLATTSGNYLTPIVITRSWSSLTCEVFFWFPVAPPVPVVATTATVRRLDLRPAPTGEHPRPLCRETVTSWKCPAARIRRKVCASIKVLHSSHRRLGHSIPPAEGNPTALVALSDEVFCYRFGGGFFFFFFFFFFIFFFLLLGSATAQTTVRAARLQGLPRLRVVRTACRTACGYARCG